MDQAQEGLQLLAQAALQMGSIAAMLVVESEEAAKVAALVQGMQVNLNQAVFYTQRTQEVIRSLLIEPQMPAVFRSVGRRACRTRAHPTPSHLWQDL